MTITDKIKIQIEKKEKEQQALEAMKTYGINRHFDKNGMLHREKGLPAIEYPSGKKEYFIHGHETDKDGNLLYDEKGNLL